ncbi:MAG: hypothetical protein ACI910_002245 [Oleispira sp.]|jgi:hypothetical protein
MGDIITEKDYFFELLLTFILILLNQCECHD